MPSIRVKERPRAPARIQMLPVEMLVPTPDNRRKSISAASVRSLAQSIKRDGLLQPIVVRVHPTLSDRWEIRAGERRWRAAKLAGLTTVPVIVRKLDNETALAVTIAENLQRQELHPLEEAETIQLAFEREYDVKAIAARLGKSVAYVARRASLTRLAKIWKTEIRKPDSDASRFTVGHLELIARLPEPTQIALTEDNGFAVFGRGFPTVEELRRIIDRDLRSLSAMPWYLDDETLDPKAGSCANCTKRSSKEPMLFPEAETPSNGKLSKHDRCLDPQCFDRKQVAHIGYCESRLRADHPSLRLVQLGVGTLNPGVREAFGNRVERIYVPKFVKAGAPKAAPAMQVDGPKAGKLVYLDLGDIMHAPDNGRNGRPRDENGRVVPMTLAERRDRLQRRRDAFVVKRVQTILQGLTVERAKEIVSPWTQRKNSRTKGKVVFDTAAMLAAFGTIRRADYIDGGDAWKSYDTLCESSPDELAAAVLRAVSEVWVKRLTLQGNEHATKQAEDARRIADILGLDFVAIADDATKSIPEPKSWATPKDDGCENGKTKTGDMAVPWIEDEVTTRLG